MQYRQLVNRSALAFTAVFSFLFASGCGSVNLRRSTDQTIWFIHATDPHVFLYTAQSPKTEDVEKKQQSLDETALTDMWRQIPSIPTGTQQLSFVVLSGDFGVEPCSIATIPAPAKGETNSQPTGAQCLANVDSKKRGDQVNNLAELLGKSPIPDVYLVAGNNDIPSESADDAGLAYFNRFIDDVQGKIDEGKKPVRLHNLTRCYVKDGVASACYADISDSTYRLIGFPSYSFKNRDTDRQTNTASQEKQFETFRALLDQARQAGKKVLVVSHIPLIDDPFTMAQDRYAIPLAIDRDPDNPQSRWSAWNVSKKISDEWEEAIASDSVAGVLAGHLHDSHKEIYRQPYTWSTVNDRKTGFSKLYMAPPLSVKNQDTSPIQARGFSLVHLNRDQIEYSIYWYNSETHDFAPDQAASLKSQDGHWKWWWAATRTMAWVYQQQSLDRLAILFIALLAAFLTVVQIWQIPEAENPLTASVKTVDAQKDAGGAKTTVPKPAFDPSPFASNFGKTVIAGLGGLAAETVLKSLDGKPTPEDREFYIVWFIVFFFAILFVSAAFRAFGESLRTRLAIIYFPPPRTARGEASEEPDGWDRLILVRDWLIYWCIYRPSCWLRSLRVPFLTFVDTFVNLIQGKNQTMTRVFSDKIVEQQRNVVSVANVVRQQLNDVILHRLSQIHADDRAKQQIKEQAKEHAGEQAEEHAGEQAKGRAGRHFNGEMELRDVRVNISVLSADQSSVFYIARTPGSALKSFPKRSMAWVSVFTGKIRWYKQAYFGNKEIVLFDNSKGAIPDGETKVMLSSYYQERDDDYEAFVLFPIPWPQRSFGSDYVKGAIHISFHRQEDFNWIWKGCNLAPKDPAPIHARNPVPATPKEQDKDSAPNSGPAPTPATPKEQDKDYTYQFEDKMLGEWCEDAQVRATLSEAIVVLGELLRGFNENIFKSSGAAGSSNDA